MHICTNIYPNNYLSRITRFKWLLWSEFKHISAIALQNKNTFSSTLSIIFHINILNSLQNYVMLRTQHLRGFNVDVMRGARRRRAPRITCGTDSAPRTENQHAIGSSLQRFRIRAIISLVGVTTGADPSSAIG